MPAPSAAEAAPVGASSGPELHVPRGTVDPVRHGDDPGWRRAAGTPPFRETGGAGPARPYSTARLLWDDAWLYLALYAADQDIRAPVRRHDAPLWGHDAFAVRLQVEGGPVYALDVAPNGALSDARLSRAGGLDSTWESGARVAMDVDGTVDDRSGPDDEEWVAYLAIPWASLGVHPTPGLRLRARLARCDTPHGGGRRCGAWGGDGPEPAGTLVLTP